MAGGGAVLGEQRAAHGQNISSSSRLKTHCQPPHSFLTARPSLTLPLAGHT